MFALYLSLIHTCLGITCKTQFTIYKNNGVDEDVFVESVRREQLGRRENWFGRSEVQPVLKGHKICVFTKFQDIKKWSANGLASNKNRQKIVLNEYFDKFLV